MFLPPLKSEKIRQDIGTSFFGLNHTLNTQEGELYDMQNMTSSYFPLLSPRNKRREIDAGLGNQTITSIYAKDQLTFALQSKKQEYRELALGYSTIKITLCSSDGEDFEIDGFGTEKPSTASDGALWLDTTDETAPILKKYSAEYQKWTAIGPVYTKFYYSYSDEPNGQFDNFGEAFEVGDIVTVHGFYTSVEPGITMHRLLTDKEFFVALKGENYIVLKVTLPFNADYNGPIAFDCKSPDCASFIIGGEPRGEISAEPQQIVAMGGHFVSFPEKVMFERTEDENSVQWKKKNMAMDIVAHGYFKDYPIDFRWCDIEGKVYEDVHTLSTPPTEPLDGYLWLDNSDSSNLSLKRYCESLLMWIPITPVYTKITYKKPIDSKGFGEWFNTSDTVKISGFYSDSELSRGLNNKEFMITATGEDYIVIEAVFHAPYSYNMPIRFERKVPELQFICEQKNRIWGCDSKENVIYASKLGDPCNWYSYRGISTDSYAANIGAGGDFTGCVSYEDYVIFFKEDAMIIVTGGVPSNFTVTQVDCKGVKKGSDKSIAVVNGILFYHSTDGIMAYTPGSSPTLISSKLNCNLHHVIAGANYNKLYIGSQISEDGVETNQYQIYVYDTERKLWHKEEVLPISHFVTLHGELLYVNAKDRKIYAVDTPNDRVKISEKVSYTAKESPHFEWFAQTGDYLMHTPDNKYISKIQFTLQADYGTKIRFYIQTDSSGRWQEIHRMRSSRKAMYTVPIIPLRCHHFKMKIAGKGNCKVYSISKLTGEASEL